MSNPEYRKSGYLGYLTRLTLPGGQKWLGDESNGMPEEDRHHADPHPPLNSKQRSYYDLYGGGKPNTEM